MLASFVYLPLLIRGNTVTIRIMERVLVHSIISLHYIHKVLLAFEVV